ncbi:transcriptional regulator, LysR family putative [Oceanicola granulosus HTCC2516]|uniref:Transcriptional regulator, LysR family putative n=1 Tax=Oceanicola granulosus (strain ATCC BAA-861 / DSM 15982 / KCTC 12143 / HTCC2516) TaxID=314256 RepID=Q2CFV3_OCEGH|nr:LysR family transcriptional regulator [Oceanicola granulosus]EAR51589.1 transcriptional regulator, LysR family putative [Oceanicola granulosus HTCC2516]
MGQRQGRITLWGVEVFVATAEEASITAAARRLSTSAATISQQLTNLERDIGATLLNRSERPVTLTPAGETFLRRANAILNEAEQARAELALAGTGALTRLRLGMIEDFDADVTPRLLSEMAGALEPCQFLLETGASHRLFDQFEARALDVVVTSDMGLGAAGHEVHPLLEEPFVVAAPRGAVAPDRLLEQLAALPHIQYTTRHHMGRTITTHLARQNLTFPQRFELDSYHAILAMVAAGAGWTILTPLGWQHAHRFREHVEILPLPGRALSRTILLTARRGIFGDMPADLAARLRRLIEALVVAPVTAEAGWLGERLQVLRQTEKTPRAGGARGSEEGVGR